MHGPSTHVDLNALVANWRMLADRSAPATAAAVVKANAYGLGIDHVAPALHEAGCNTFYVAWTHEGAQLRAILGTSPTISVFHGPTENEIPIYLSHNLRPVLNTPDQLALWLGSHAANQPYSLHLDTGMNRLGLSPADWTNAQAATAANTPSHILSHLACPDTPNHPKNAEQLEAFKTAAQLWPNAKKSLSSTAGIYLGPDYLFDETRPGIGLYGGGPTPAIGPTPQAVITVKAPILQTRTIPANQTAGYGATWTSPEPRHLATIGIGYADGFLRAASNRAKVFVDGNTCPIVGRVSMDTIIVDITETSAKTGDQVEIWGPNLWINQQADAMSTIDYELLTSLAERGDRTYSEAT